MDGVTVSSGVPVIGVQFRRAGKIYDFTVGDVVVQAGDDVVVDTERGPSVAKVVQVKYLDGHSLSSEIRPILRVATKTDMTDGSKLDPDAMTAMARERVALLKIDMRVLKAEVQFGGNKVILYFSSPGRVDFRDLVKDLATGMRARIELKQVGARDEAKIVGGLGICGREYCCSSFLRDFVPVSIKMAKNQNLALNPSKVSGGCGRLLCCLTYENDVYSELRKKLPPRGVKVRFDEDQIGIVMRSDVLNQTVVLETEDGQQVTQKISDIELLEGGKGQGSSQGSGGAPAPAADSWGEDIDIEGLEEAADDDIKG